MNIISSRSLVVIGFVLRFQLHTIYSLNAQRVCMLLISANVVFIVVLLMLVERIKATVSARTAIFQMIQFITPSQSCHDVYKYGIRNVVGHYVFEICI